MSVVSRCASVPNHSADERFDATFHTNVLVNSSGACQYIPPGENTSCRKFLMTSSNKRTPCQPSPKVLGLIPDVRDAPAAEGCRPSGVARGGGCVLTTHQNINVHKISCGLKVLAANLLVGALHHVAWQVKVDMISTLQSVPSVENHHVVQRIAPLLPELGLGFEWVTHDISKNSLF